MYVCTLILDYNTALEKEAWIYTPRSKGCNLWLPIVVIIKETKVSRDRLRILGIDKVLSTRVKQTGNAFA